MNEEQNNTENSSENKETTGKASAGTLPSQPVAGSKDANRKDDYYAVDDAEKGMHSTIGDGEMHNEGLAGEGDTDADSQSATERLADIADEDDIHDTEE